MDYKELRHRARRFVIASIILVCVPFSTAIILAAIFLQGLWPVALFRAMAASLYSLPFLFKHWLIRAVGPCPHCGRPRAPGGHLLSILRGAAGPGGPGEE